MDEFAIGDKLAEALFEIGRQMAITNRLKIAQEEFRLQQLEPDHYLDILCDIEEELT